MYETWDRTKAITDGRHMLEVKHKIDSEYQATLRRKEQEREQIERKREEQMSKHQRRLLTLTSIYSTRSYERPWVTGMASKRQTAVSDAWWNCNSKPLVKTQAAKLPAITSMTDRKKYAPASGVKNVSVNFDTTNPASHPEILTKRTRLHERALPKRAVLTAPRDPQDGVRPTPTHQQKAPGRGPEDPINGREEANDKKPAPSSKTSAHFNQYKRDIKTPEGVLRYKSRVLQPHSPLDPQAPSASSQEPYVSSVTENNESSLAPLNSSKANGLSSSYLNSTSNASPGSAGASGVSLSRRKRSSLTPPILSKAGGLTSDQLSWPTNAPTTVFETSGSSLSQPKGLSRVPPSSSSTYDSVQHQQKESYDSPPSTLAASISLERQLNAPSRSPTISEGTDGCSISQLFRPSDASPTSAPSTPSTFKFREEGFYDSLNIVAENEDTTEVHVMLNENLPTTAGATTSNLNENDSFGQTSFAQVTPTESWWDVEDTENTSLVSSTRVSVENTAAHSNVAPSSGENTPVGHEGERLWRSSRYASLENSLLGDPLAEPVHRINLSEYTTARINDNGGMQDNQNNSDCVSEGTTRRANQAQVMHSNLISPRSFTLSSQGQEELATVNTDTSCLEVADVNGSPRFNASRNPMSPIRNRISFSTRNCEPLLGVSTTMEAGNRQLGRSTDSQSNRQSPTSVVQRDSEEVLQNSFNSSIGASSPHRVLLNLSQGHSMGSSLQETLPLALLAMSDLHPQAGLLDQRLLLHPAAVKDANRPRADPEKLRRLKESLMEEDSEEEGDMCRICLIPGGTMDNPLLEPCHCGGSLQFVHKECLIRWLKAKITSGTELEAVRTCELCRRSLQCDLGDFNLEDFYNTHQQSQGQSDLMNSGLYLMLLLHLYEQRYAELLRLTHSRARRDMLFRNYQMLRTEANASMESGDDEEDSEHRSPSRIA